MIFCFKQKTAYEMRISDWSSDVCSSDLCPLPRSMPKLPPSQTPYVYSVEELRRLVEATPSLYNYRSPQQASMYRTLILLLYGSGLRIGEVLRLSVSDVDLVDRVIIVRDTKFFKTRLRSEEHTSELQSLMR